MEHSTGLIAVDAGGTSTRTVVLDPTGRCLAYAVAGSGNPTAVGPEAAAASVAEGVVEALRRAKMPGRRVRLVLLAMAGAGSTSAAAAIRHRLAGLGLDAPLAFESDLLATYFSGTQQPDGYALIAGTGAGAIRVEGGREVDVADALGWLLGDEGSGFWIGRRVVRAALAELDGRGPGTALTPLVLGRLGVATRSGGDNREAVMAAVRTVYGGPPVRLADYAGLAFEVEGDETADRILDEAAAGLARTLGAVRSPSVSGPVVLGGGILTRGRRLSDRVAAGCGAAEVRVVTDGALGVCVLTLRHAGTSVDAALFQQVTTSLDAVR